METLTIVCAAVIIQCAAPTIEIGKTTMIESPLNLEEDLEAYISAIRRCQHTCPKKCLTKFIKHDKNTYWAVCGG